MPRARSKRIRGGSKKKIVLPTVPTSHQRKAKEIQQQHIERAREDVNFFIEYCFEHYDKELKKSFPLIQGWMHRQWQALMGMHDRLIIIAARGHGKTRQCVYRALWELGRDPNHIIKIICQSNAKAIKRLTMIRAEMRSNKRLHAVFPHLNLAEAVEENKTNVTVKREVRVPDPSIEALGITSSASGDRATILLADDVVDRRNAITLPKVREQIKEAWDDWVNLLGGDGGVIWYIATLWHDKALTNELMANPAWSVGWYEVRKDLGCYVKLPDGREYEADHELWGWDPSCPIHPTPAMDEVDDGEEEEQEEEERYSIDPSKASELSEPSAEEDEPAPALNECRERGCRCGPWTKPILRKRRGEIGPRQFARGFSNRPMAEGELKVNPAWIDWYPYDPPDDWYWYVSIDTAESQEAQAAWTGIVIAAVNPENGHIWIFDAYHVKLQFPDRVALVKQIYREFLPELIIIERAGGGISLLEHLTATTSIPLFGMPTKTKGGNSKSERLESTTPRMAAHQILFAPELDPSPGGAELVNPERGDLITELLEFRKEKDLCDAYAHLVRYVSVVHPFNIDELLDMEDNDNADGGRRPRLSRAEDDGFSVTLIG